MKAPNHAPVRHPARRLALAVTATATALGASAQTVREAQVVALLGEPITGLAAGAEYGVVDFNSAVLGANGHVAFKSFISGNGNADYGIFSGLPGEIRPVVVEGDPAVGAAGGTFGVLPTLPVVVGPDGGVSFLSRLSTGAFGVWVKPQGGDLTAVAIQNEPAQGIPAGTRIAVNPPLSFVANGAGQVAVRAPLVGPGITPANNSIILFGQPGALQIFAREGSAAPDVPGATFGDFALSGSTLSLDGAGTLSFNGPLNPGGGVNFQNDHGLWSGVPGDIDLLVREGDPAPGQGNAVHATSLAQVRRASDGHVVFKSVFAVGNFAIYLRRPDGSSERVAVGGTAAPGINNLNFGNLHESQPVVSQGGKVAFSSLLTDGGLNTFDSVWYYDGDGDGLVLLGSPGTRAPGFPSPVTFATIDPPSVAGEWVAFKGSVTGPGITQIADEAVWAGRGGVVEPVLREGDLIEIDGNQRRVSAIVFTAPPGGPSGGDDGHPAALAPDGRMAVGVTFDFGGPSSAVLLIGGGEPTGVNVDLDVADAFGLRVDDPRGNSGANPVVVRSGNALEITFVRQSGANAFVYRLETSNDLRVWANAGFPLDVAPDQDGVPAGYFRARAMGTAPGTEAFFRVVAVPVAP